MSAPSLDSRLAPPTAPPPTHGEKYASLPTLAPGDAASRLERGRAYLKGARELIFGWHREGMAGLSVCRLLSRASDTLLEGLFRELSAEQGHPRGLALVALGGYGRRELAPHSDLDLLLLRHPRAKDAEVKPLALKFSTLLWDLKLALGWSVRTPSECARAAEEDHTVRTALLDCRFLSGDEKVFLTLTQESLRELLAHRADTFIGQKAEELQKRREKFGESVFLLEPNLKQGEGGLRDLEAALWVAKARFRTRGLTGLLQASVLPPSEVAVLRNARDLLLRIRHQLHLERGRKEDRLTFDLQETVAAAMGYRPTVEGLAVEQFMRDYYLSAQAIRRAADALIARCEETRSPRGPFLPERRLGAFKVFRGRITLEGNRQRFQEDPASVVALFRTADETGLPIYSYARDQVSLALPKLAAARGEPSVTAALKALLVRTQTRGRFLWEMHELGVLGTLLPEFGRITARHQHDLYHVYTVDIHSLFALTKLYALRAGDLVQEQPELSREMRDLADPLPLYLGMMFHDAGKGMGGNHSERGRELMVAVGERLGLTPRQREVAEFLVLHHLLMSHTAQRRDLSDPELIAEFAKSVGDVERLRCLYLLSFADISSVGPSMWTAWKAQLFKELYDKTLAHLLGTRPDSTASAGARAEFLARWTQAFGPQVAEELGGMLSERYFATSDAARATLHKRLLWRARRATMAALLVGRPQQGFSEIHLSARDRPGFLSLATGVLAAHRIDILRARIESTTDGLVLDVFDVRSPQGGPLERARWRRARADLLRVLEGRLQVAALLEKRQSASGLERPKPRVETKVSVDNRASQKFTVVDVRAEDRIGLLHAVTGALAAEGTEIVLAKVGTEANRAIDSFYLTRGGQKILDPEELDRLVAAVVHGVEAGSRGSRATSDRSASP